MKVFITQPLEREAITLLENAGIEVVCSGVSRPLTRKEFLDGIADADGVIFVWHTEVLDSEALDHAPKLKIAARRGVGYDNIDIAEAERRGIEVTVTPVHTHTIADLTFGLMINAARKLHHADAFVRSGQWTEAGTWVAQRFIGYDVSYKTIGIIGFGKIGKHMAKRARGFDMEVLYNDVISQPEAEKELGATFVSLDELYARSDFISINCALTEQTRSMIGREAIAKMKDTAVIVLSARGGIVDEEALYEALSTGKLGAAGLDVFEEEPVSLDSPLLKLENTAFSPHLGTSVMETRVRMATTAAEDVIRVLREQAPLYSLLRRAS
ncbi:2-hydroxyacid dehydrogenase [Sinorhizobium meliloti]|jgi:D-3-phosphoglycerate dehydrogenase|uniref:2-hydroxyacid dehydrogenase n=1 Tax=Rhizobium meliloti TaxID=382 RepID=UPI000FD40353|nr:D-glycerate dehydrogenase [Sinorhizobium meliloti]MQV20506.1 D-glycerate dehydrogenase [Sinorhizobium meliloti]MQV33068.1 D-glycerate dehydrogenase [Sinorhizobium meliloti]RVE85666.1 D-glycerate dehydrogenase [Sinorhizobium meliloti]RVG49040.1 D-glycerate dehydrogenase [Sinorhizobium meliloti]RVM03715.1 D-glycerate dehydrogenase [Sinorhizobium meliloti]